jgi:hypothetical protein
LRAEVNFTMEEVRTDKTTSWWKGISDLRADGRRTEIMSKMTDSFATADPLDTADFALETHLIVDADSSIYYNRPTEPGALGNAAVSKNPQRMRKQISGGPTASLLGHFARDLESITAIMKTGDITVTEEKSPDGTPCYLLESKTPADGLYKVWIDANSPDNIRRIEVRKASGQRFMGQPLADASTAAATTAPAAADAAQPDTRPDFAKNRWPASVTYEYEVKEFQQVQGTRLPGASDYSLAMTFPDGKTTVMNVHCEWRDIDLRPDFAELGAFELAIPDGAIAFPPENPERKSHVWKDGKIVPAGE